MLIMPVLTAALETALNQLLFRDRSMKAARQRLHGKTLRVDVAELDTPLVLVFSEYRLDVVSQWSSQPDCLLQTRLSALMKLRDRQQLSALMRSGELVLEGDIQVAQQFVTLLDLAEFDPAEWLSPWFGDVVAEGLSQAAGKVAGTVMRSVCRQQQALSETVTEEWRLTPGKLEGLWFADEVDVLAQSVDTLAARLAKLEDSP
ncbi:SCP2 domain-containing protein [Dickeya sp. CFBP 2040]|uniref:Ubiquinone biosynthesis accessory factor UbiJ n=1 Tax=Dickeya poaceiphila TaxID=568768 RepID=A0A5B8IC43_9GAMM|nr:MULTISPECIES: SCP2 domain-containing protein [Dickeya]NKI74508.1 SCP2 domain-containing protein [Dickeya sp. CFBP 2040]QDX31691.1 SCP2 domain-containing protein [Dickeya poaceiphila]